MQLQRHTWLWACKHTHSLSHAYGCEVDRWGSVFIPGLSQIPQNILLTGPMSYSCGFYSPHSLSLAHALSMMQLAAWSSPPLSEGVFCTAYQHFCQILERLCLKPRHICAYY